MIKFEINNQRIMKLTQKENGENVTVTIENQKGEIENTRNITGQDMISLMNYYDLQKRDKKELI